ncbi:MAG: ATP-binding protein [Desulfobacterales bacterium]|nr:ATP-binding protein [Desulfobacterales bacterium]
MKIKELHLKNIGPLNQSFNFQDEWSGNVHNRILLSGPNGSGKTIILRTIAMLWEALGHWLDHRKVTPSNSIMHQYIKQKQSAALVLSEFPLHKEPVIIFFGNYLTLSYLTEKYKNSLWIGESLDNYKTGSKRSFYIPKEDNEWIDNWTEARKKMILTFDKSDTSNMIWLDPEQRQWVTPRRNLGKPLSENPGLRWLVKYQATEDWQGQLEASLINLKSTRLHKYHQVIRDLNEFLYGKEIDPNVKPGENRLQVIIKNKKGKNHSIDDLSAGEHQVMIQLYMVSRWLEEGGIILIDEPDLFLHPSLITGFLSKLESLAEEKNGQLIITSHNPDVWKRYERKGLRIPLGGEL